MLVNYLERRRYVVVLDDVWDTELWNNIKVALPNSQLGCRVIITTWMENIAAKSFEVGSNIHHIKPLEENKLGPYFVAKPSHGMPGDVRKSLKIWPRMLLQRAEAFHLQLCLWVVSSLLNVQSWNGRQPTIALVGN
ncbi:hypothetical protein Tsubulata_027424 [Turnera subulata]|uniref:NB-ARC domain-containing protein n=1 Tax=Turnera subulata TaxID=218843 RepID=A0A9Q0G9E5_9ROSI|nr:hypothetical protein Tsubulata_027424 [Turnera subulata]